MKIMVNWKKNYDPFSPETAKDPRLPEWIGNHLVRLDKIKKGLEYYNEALEKNPLSVNLLLRRANANVKCFDISKSTADIENAVNQDPSDMNAVNQKMNLMYLNGEFEKSMLLGVRNLKNRRQPPYFSLGVLRAKGTIENCVCKKAGHPLRDHYEIIRELAWLKNMSMLKGKPKKKRHNNNPKMNRISKAGAAASVVPQKPVKQYEVAPVNESQPKPIDENVVEMNQESSGDSLEKIAAEVRAHFGDTEHESSSVRMIKPIYRTFSAELTDVNPSPIEQSSAESSLEDSIADHDSVLKLPKVVYPYQPLQRRTKNIDNFMSSSYLGELFQEKKFLSTLPKTPGCVGKNIDANKMIFDASTEGVYTLDTTKEILRTRKPFYHIKYQEHRTKSKKLEMDKLKLLERKKIRSIKIINNFFENIAGYVQNQDLYHMSKAAESMYQYCKITDKNILPDRDDVLCRLYKLVGDGYFVSNKFLPMMTATQMWTRMNLAIGLPIKRTNSQESLCKRIIGRSYKRVDQIATYEQRVMACKYMEELIWLYHELARFNIEIGKYSMAKNNAVKCTYEARKYEKFEWALNGYMLMIKIAVHQKNKRDANRHLRNAISTAKNLNNEEVCSFLQSCWQVMDEHKFEGPKVEDLMKYRQTKIVGLIDKYEMRREAVVLFEHMLSRPYERRLPIVPGLVNTEESFLRHQRRDEKEHRHEYNESPERGKEAEKLISGFLLPSETLKHL